MSHHPASHRAPGAPRVTALAAGEGRALWFLDALAIVKQSAADGAAYGLLEYRMAAGSCTPLHRHLAEVESVYVLAGELTVFVGDQRFEAGPEAYLRLPAGVPHGLIARSDARMLVWSDPDGFVGLVEAMGEPAPRLSLPPKAPPDLERLLPLAARYHLEILGPLAETA